MKIFVITLALCIMCSQVHAQDRAPNLFPKNLQVSTDVASWACAQESASKFHKVSGVIGIIGSSILLGIGILGLVGSRSRDAYIYTPLVIQGGITLPFNIWQLSTYAQAQKKAQIVCNR